MASVWYVGTANKRVITSEQWTAAGFTQPDTIWGEENGYSIPESEFSASELTFLGQQSGFQTGADNGPRPGSAIIPNPGYKINEERLAEALLDYVAKGTLTKPSGDTRVGVLDWSQDSATGYLLHLTLGPNSGAANAAMAIGTDRGLATGLLISHKNAGRGIDIGVQPGAGSGMQIINRSAVGFPLRVMMKAGALPVSLRAEFGAGFADGTVTAGSPILTSATAAFVAGDVGKTITQLTSRGPSDPFGSIPAGTTILSVQSATQVTMSANAAGTSSTILFEVGSRVVPDSQVLLSVQGEDAATYTTFSKDGIIARGAAVGSTPLRANGKAGQTAPIFAVYSSASALLSYIGSKGHYLTGVTDPIVAGDLNTSRGGFWLDPTPGATKIKFAAKDSAGTFRTGEISLA